MGSRYPVRIIVLSILGLFVSVVASLQDGRSQQKPLYQPTGGEGSFSGTILFEGKPPQPLRIDTTADPICGRVNPNITTEWVIVTDHKLANVVVYLTSESLDTYSFEAPTTEFTLAHKGCRYEPHVLGMQIQQTLRVLNNDPTQHNTHPAPKHNREWNQSQPAGAAAIEHRFSVPEHFIPIKDNQHPWEKAYVGVFSHPFFSVSSTAGTYKISGVPPGQYTVKAWHESLGTQSVEVFLAGSEHKTLDFTFKSRPDNDR